MRWLAAGLTYVNFATVAAVVLGTISGGLHRFNVICSLSIGLVAAGLAFLQPNSGGPVTATEQPEESLRQKRKSARTTLTQPPRYRHFWLWTVVLCFAVFAFRSFCWLYYIDGNEFKIQSPNNLGDLGLHLSYIKYFASGVPIWPDNPIYFIGRLRYPAGIDIFNALTTIVGINLQHALTWTGLLGAAATCYGLYRWSGTFGIAGFLFNGGLAGFAYLNSLRFLDYQGDKTVAWKSLALSMLVTQRGLLYALPVGLLLLCHWRRKFFPISHEQVGRSYIPFWVEVSLYATMPLFHAHTFIALSALLAFFFVFGNSGTRRDALLVVAIALIPATFFVWEVTDHFNAGSMLKWQPGWVQSAPGEMAKPFLLFWVYNFGVWLPIALALLCVVGSRAWRARQMAKLPFDAPLVFLAAGTTLFLFACLIKTAPWEWDNLKIIIWAYLILLPFLWSELLHAWPIVARVAICSALFFSGFVTLVGGLAAGRTGFGIADRGEVDTVADSINKLHLNGRFAGFATYNHPVLLSGKPMALGYPGHLWTQGLNYDAAYNKLRELMLGNGNWRQLAQDLGVRYLFWGKQENLNYPGSKRPWERELPPLVSNTSGAIYDLKASPAPPR